jgi:hypothetical protein
MFVDSRCARCHRSLRIPEWNRSKTLRCPGCADVIPSSFSPVGEAKTKAEPIPNRSHLPWLLLLSAGLPLGLWLWTGHGVLWALLGFVLGGFCMLLGQRGRWPMSLRIGVSLSLALLGHGLTLASSRNGVPHPHNLTSHISDSVAPASSLDPHSVMGVGPTANNSTSSELEYSLLQGLRDEMANRSPSPDLRPTARIGDLLAVTAAVAPNDDGLAIVARNDGVIQSFTYPDFHLCTTHRLDGVAYRLALAGRSRALWAAVCEADKLQANRYGDRPLERADLHVYDLSSATSERLHPRRVFPIGGTVLELLLSPDQSTLFYLAQTDDGVRLGRVNAVRQELECRVSLPEEIRALSLTPDGLTLYAAGNGSVRILDAATLRTRRSLEVKTNAYAVAANNEGCVYLAEQGQWTNLTCLDLRDSQPTLHSWSARLHGRIYLKMSPDQHRLYVGSSSVISDHLDVLLIRGHSWKTPPRLSMPLSTPQTPLLGEFFLTPDGRFLINRWGQVFHLAQGKVTMPFTNLGDSLVSH